MNSLDLVSKLGFLEINLLKLMMLAGVIRTRSIELQNKRIDLN